MPIGSLHVHRVLAVIACCAYGFGRCTSALAENERWVNHYRGETISAPDRALGIVFHQSGEITVVGVSCNDLVVLRLDGMGRQLWSRSKPEDYYYVTGVRAVSAGEDVIVAATYKYPYQEIFTDLYRYDRLGNTSWEDGSKLLNAMVGDGAGGVLLGGYALNDLCPCPGFIRRIGADGQNLWGHLILPEDFPERILSGNINVLAVQDSAYVFASGSVSGETLSRSLILRYTSAGELEWHQYVLPDEDDVGVAWIAPASDTTFAAAGNGALGPWLARHAPNGEQLWIRRLPSLPLLAASPSGVVYTATSTPGSPDGSDIRLAAIDHAGKDLWEVIYDSGPGTLDFPSILAIAPNGEIIVLAKSDSSLRLLRYDTAGRLLEMQVTGQAPPSGTSLALDSDQRRVFAFGEVAKGACCDGSTDLLVLGYDQSGTGPQELIQLDSPMRSISSYGTAVQVGPTGEVTAAFNTAYHCANSVDLVHYTAEGQEAWHLIHPEGALVCFHDSGDLTVACHRPGGIQLARYDHSGSKLWAQGIAGLGLSAVANAGANGMVLVVGSTQVTTVIMVDANGSERWRQSIPAVRGVASVVGPDGRVYVRGWTEDLKPRYDCLTGDGELEWTRVLDGPENFFPEDFAADEGGVLYLTGSGSQAGQNGWLTWQIGPDGSPRWTVLEPATGPTWFLNRPFRIRTCSGGGVVVGGSIQTTTSDAVIVRYADDGSMLWRSGGDTVPEERFRDLAVDAAGNVLMTMDEGVNGVRTRKYDPGGSLLWSSRYSSGSTQHNAYGLGVGRDLTVAVVGGIAPDSAFTIKYEDPTPVEISKFAAVWNGEDVMVSWELGAGLAPLGFNVLHGSAPDRIKDQVNLELIPADAQSFLHHAAPPGDAYYVLEVLELDGGSIRHGPVLATVAGAPAAFWAMGPYPNPARDAVEWQVGLPVAGRLRIAVHDALGRTVAEVVDQVVPAGEHRIPWDGRLASHARAPAGIYFYRLTAGAETRTGKLVLSPPR
jgi:hypothetical protein